MLCDVCLNGLEGMWDPTRTPRLALKTDFKENTTSVPPATHKTLTPGDPQEKPDIENYIYAHHTTKSSFLSSIQAGCVMCNRFDPEQEQSKNAKIESTGYFSVFSVYGTSGSRPLMTVRYLDSQGGFGLVPVGDPRFDSLLNFHISPSTGDPETWAIIEGWLDECVETHEYCKNVSTPRYLPTRLLEIDGTSFKLVAGEDVPPSERYVTLSDRWSERSAAGDLGLLQTTYDHLRTEQAISSLPKTFRDAMTITSRLGIKYLWIDKFCIYQDRADDWRREARVMQDVYKNSFLTISALGAKDDGEGCFFDRDPRNVAPTIVRLREAPDAVPKDFRFDLEKGWAWRLTFGTEPVAKRGWVIQERLLSPRVLHFGRKQVFWECREKNACEIHPKTVYCYRHEDQEGLISGKRSDKQPRPHLWKQLLNAPDRRVVDDNTEDGEYEQLFLDWSGVANTYAESSLTSPSDRLVVISGLATDMKHALNALRPDHEHRYLAGLWEEKLIDHLIWNMRGPGERVKEYIAPSWSWASVEGRFNLGLRYPAKENRIDFVEIKEAETEVLGNLDTGEVKGGWLRLVGPWMQLKLLPQDESAYWQHGNERAVELFLNSDTGDEIKEEGGALSTGQRFPRARVLFDDLSDVVEEEAVGVQVLACNWAGDAYAASALVLSKIEGESAEWRRTGVLSSYFANRDTAKAFFEKFSRKEVTIK